MGPVDFVAVDVSGSMSSSDLHPNRLSAASAAVISFVDGSALNSPGTHLALLAYNNKVQTLVPPIRAGSASSRFQAALDSLSPGGGTAQGRAMEAVLQWKQAHPKADPVRFILLTDGHSNSGPSPLFLAEKLKEAGVTLCMIGVGESPRRVNEADLKACASMVRGTLQYWFIKDGPDLIRRFRSLVLAQI